MEHSIKLYNNITIFELVRKLTPIFSDINRGNKVHLNIVYSCGDFIHSEIYVLLVSLYNFAKSKRITIVATYNLEQKCSTLDYAARINFFKLMDIDFQELNRRRARNENFLEITEINHYTVSDATQEILDCVNKHLPVTEEEKDAATMNLIDQSLWELNCNLTEHSGEQVDTGTGFVYVQNYDNWGDKYPKGIIKLSIVDCGIGIPASLKKKEQYSNLSDLEALVESMKIHVTSRNVAPNKMGMGLYRVDEFVRYNGGKLCVISGNCYYLREANDVDYNSFDSNFFWQGTAIFVIFDKNTPVRVKDVVGSNALTYYELAAENSKNDQNTHGLW